NPGKANQQAHSYPAVVNHVVYFGHDVSRKTVLKGFRITGARNFTTGHGERSPIESDDVRKTTFFYTDGCAIKIYAGSSPTIDGSRATVSRCTFTGNWNGVDDEGAGSTYVDSIFWKNTLPGGISPGGRYELDIADAAGVRGCFIHGDANDLRGNIDLKANRMN